MSKKYKIALSIVSVLILISVVLLISKKTFDDKKVEKPTVVSEVVESMDEYGYTLDDRDSKLFKEKYYELKEILDAEEIDYEAYAKSLASLFAIDLLSIDNKVNKYDVGGLEYIYESEKEVFQRKVIDSIYDIVEDNSYGNRKQKLPMVKNIETSVDKKESETINDVKKDSYVITVSLEYEEDLGYDSEIKIKVVKDENKMYIIEYTTNK